MKYTKFCSSFIIATSLASSMLTFNANKTQAATFGLTYGSATKIHNLNKSNTDSWARVNWKVITDREEYDAFHVIDHDKPSTVENGNLFKVNHRMGMLPLPQGYKYIKIPENVKMPEKAGNIANYQGVIKRTSKTTYNPNVKSHLRVHYIYSTKNTSGNVVLSEGESDQHVIDENAKKGIHNEGYVKTFTGTQGETRKIDLTKYLLKDEEFAPDDDQDLFLTMPNGKYTFGDCDVDIYVGIADPPQQQKQPSDDFYTTIHYMKDGKEIDQENNYDQVLPDKAINYDRTNPLYLKHMPNTLDMDNVNAVINGYDEIVFVNRNHNEDKYFDNEETSGLQNALDILKLNDPKLKEYQEKGLTSLIGNVFFAPNGEKHKNVYVNFSDNAQKVTPIKENEDNSKEVSTNSAINAKANIGAKVDQSSKVSNKSAIEASANIGAKNTQSNTTAKNSNVQKRDQYENSATQNKYNANNESNTVIPADTQATNKESIQDTANNNSSKASYVASDTKPSQSAPIDNKIKQRKTKQDEKTEQIQSASNSKMKLDTKRPAETKPQESTKLQKENQRLLPQTGTKTGGFLLGFVLVIAGFVLPFFNKKQA